MVQWLMSSPVTSDGVPKQAHRQHNRVRSGTLTNQECKIVELVRQGLSNKEIGERLCISTITVRHHLTSIFDKSGVPNRQHLILKTLELNRRPLQSEASKVRLEDEGYAARLGFIEGC